MTGMRHFNRLPLAGIYLISGFSNVLLADVITLAGGDARLSGTVHSINEAGVVELASELSPEPLWLKGGAVIRIGFNGKESEFPSSSALLELVNGDFLPITIESLDDRKLVVHSLNAGRLEISREFLKSMQIGIHKRKVLYSGPKAADEWTSPNKEKKWEFEQGGFVSRKMASASRKFELPEQFILRFTLIWEAKQTPGFKVCFADSLVEMGKPTDRYYITFNSAGFELKRVASEGKQYSTLKQLNRTPNQFPDHQLKVEMRVDRKTSRIRLFLNDEDEGVIADSIPKAPKGSGITLECNAMGGAQQGIQDIEILEYDEARGRHGSEERGDKKNDSLISTEDDRWSGNLTSIHKSDAGAVFSFKSDFQKDALEISEKNVSTVFFAEKDEKKPDIKANPFILRLQGEGALHVSSCQLNEKTAVAEHPLLGTLNLQRAGIIGLEKSESKTNTRSDP